MTGFSSVFSTDLMCGANRRKVIEATARSLSANNTKCGMPLPRIPGEYRNNA